MRPSLKLLALVGALGGVTASPAQTPPRYLDSTAPVEERVADLLPRLTLDEKIALLSGNLGVRAVPRLKLPLLKYDGGGPLGLRYGRSTAYPATLALASAFSPELAREYGVSVARDCRARGIHLLLGPGVNICRFPHGGRNFEHFSEDPFLSTVMGVSHIRGVQSQGVAATVHCLATYNHEADRLTHDAVVDERALREIYLPAFRAAVQEAGVSGVMNAYNKLNGIHCTAHDWLNNQVLKGEWGFQGLVMSDWGATHDTLGAANGGLDLEMPSGKFFNAAKLKPLLDSGAVTMATIDDKVRRILRLEIRNGFLDRVQANPSIPQNDPHSAEVALRIARAGMVLLKNDRAALPLDRQRVRKLAVLGPNAAIYAAGGGSSLVTPYQKTTPLEGLREIGGENVQVEYLGLDAAKLLDQLFPAARYEGPLKLEYRRRTAMPDPIPGEPPTGRPIPGGETDRIDQFFGTEAPVPELSAGDFVAVWTGRIRPATSGRHAFALKASAGIRVLVDGQPVLFCFDHNSTNTAYAERVLEADRSYALTVEYVRRRENERIRFAWGPAPALLSAEETERVRQADAAVVCVGFTMLQEAEDHDRSYELPDRQAELIQTVARLNPRTIVTVNSGGGVASADWIGQVPALLHAWYPGQAGGRALAELIFGDVNPSGKLPLTWEKRWEDCAAYGHYPARDGRIEYAEGIFVGYRWFDHQGIEPLFPFGHGLSYTRFAYGRLEVANHESGWTVTFDISNVGPRAGDEIAQIYVAPPTGAVPRPPRELKGFTRVSLAPGEYRRVSVSLPREAFAYFDGRDKAWRVDPGDYLVEVGASSRDLRLSEHINVR